MLQVNLQDLNWVQYLFSYCLYYLLKDKTSENSAKKGAYLNAYFWHFLTLAPLLDTDFNTRNKLLTKKLSVSKTQQKIFSKFYRRYYDLISKFQVGLESLLRQGPSEPECYGDLVYKLKKIVGSNNFSAQFIKIISHYKKISYNINVLQHTACFVVNPITVGNFAFLLIARRWVGLQTLRQFRLKGLSIDEMVGTWCFGYLSGPPGFACWMSFAPIFSFIYCWVLIFALSPCYILIYVF